MIVKADKRFQNVFDQLIRHGKAYTFDMSIPRNFAKVYPELIDNKFLDIGHSQRTGETLFVTRPFVQIRPGKKRYEFYKIL